MCATATECFCLTHRPKHTHGLCSVFGFSGASAGPGVLPSRRQAWLCARREPGQHVVLKDRPCGQRAEGMCNSASAYLWGGYLHGSIMLSTIACALCCVPRPQSGVVMGGTAILSAVNGLTPHVAGAIDIMVVQQPDGSFKCSPFYGGRHQAAIWGRGGRRGSAAAVTHSSPVWALPAANLISPPRVHPHASCMLLPQCGLESTRQCAARTRRCTSLSMVRCVRALTAAASSPGRSVKLGASQLPAPWAACAWSSTWLNPMYLVKPQRFHFRLLCATYNRGGGSIQHAPGCIRSGLLCC